MTKHNSFSSLIFIMATAFLMRITNPMIRKLEARSKYLEEMVEECTKKLLEAQEQLICKEKLAVLGQLAGGVGHELRSPLGVMSNAVYYLKMILSDADETIKKRVSGHPFIGSTECESNSIRSSRFLKCELSRKGKNCCP